MQKVQIENLIAILQQAGSEIIVPAFTKEIHYFSKNDGSPVTVTDLRCQAFITQQLLKLYPSIAVLGEEMPEYEQRALLQANNSRLWCLDPLDGTTNFASNLPCFAISLALIENGLPIIACIHDPIRNETFTAIRGQGARLNGLPITAAKQVKLADTVAMIDFKRLPTDIAIDFASQPFYRSQRNLGTCALEWAWLAAGRAHLIIHGREKIWDFAAGSLIAEEAGCSVANFTNSPLFPTQSLSRSVLATCCRNIHSEIRQQLAAVTGKK
ncbi:MAG: inositol monophosphatase [Mariprofundus sp.]|nr:inositol monophosphatase [Mariprofundus sp.]